MYLKNYVNSINNGLIESTFKINQKKIDGDAFFEKLVGYTNEVELNKGRTFLSLEMEQALRFQTTWH